MPPITLRGLRAQTTSPPSLQSQRGKGHGQHPWRPGCCNHRVKTGEALSSLTAGSFSWQHTQCSRWTGSAELTWGEATPGKQRVAQSWTSSQRDIMGLLLNANRVKEAGED